MPKSDKDFVYNSIRFHWTSIEKELYQHKHVYTVTKEGSEYEWLICFLYIIATFLEHLIWLDMSSKPRQAELECECVVCQSSRQTQTTRASSSDIQDDVATPSEGLSSSATGSDDTCDTDDTADASGPSDDPETIRLTPLTCVHVEPMKSNCYVPPATFSIPLPKLRTADEAILLNSKRFME
ncbi:hypothetical protein [Parasitella parasitica]|uniref:Uncharacterized protein n=1 Tax=Parasitella parasitica TaxID=35722 RepID=A0A0B7N9G9_9FUNG|nr:hypothetical protein [Parasitella parasitica]